MAIIHVIPAGNLPLPPDVSQQRNVAIYIRISTSRGSQPNSLDNQISMLIHYVNETPQYHLYGLYVDIGSGRGAESRKELTRLLEDCRKRRVQVIVTKSISRFGRNTLDTLNVCRELKSLGVDVYFHNEQIHMIDPNGELTLTVASALAESESYEKSMNIRWGLEKSARNPDSKIYSRVCYGYRKDSDGNLVIEDDQAAVVRQISSLKMTKLLLSGRSSRCTPAVTVFRESRLNSRNSTSRHHRAEYHGQNGRSRRSCGTKSTLGIQSSIRHI